MRPRTAARLAWFVWGFVVLLAALDLALSAVDKTGAMFIGDLPLTAMTLGMGTAGALVASRRTSNSIGWLLLGIGASSGIASLAKEYAIHTLITDPGSLPGGAWAAWAANWVAIVALGLLLTFLPLLFPDGRLPSRRWRPIAWFSGGLLAIGAVAMALVPGPFAQAGGPADRLPGRNPVGVEAAGAALTLLLRGTEPIFVVLAVVAASSLILRFRRSGREERQQIKWFAFAAAVLAATVFLNGILEMVGMQDQWISTASGILAFSAIPVSLGIAIFRYRLYDIDLVIAKTVVLGALAAFITAVYVAVVVGLGNLIGTRGEPNVALSILATALVAVAFQPVRERVQRLANRVVYGRRATPYEVLSAFAARMGGTFASEELLPRMARALAEGTGASSAEVWLNVGEKLHRAVAWPEEAEPTETIPVVGSELPAFEGATRAVPVAHQGELLGALALVKPPGEPLAPAEDKLLADLASQAGLVLRNIRLIQELKASRQRLVTARDAERRRLERDIHDGAQQRLVTLSLAVRMARAQLGPEAQPGLAKGVDEAADELKLTLSELRDLARGIHPAILTEEGLGPALVSLAERSPVPVTLARVPDGRFVPEVEVTAYYVVSEALTNAAKYARASAIIVSAARADGRLVVEVADDGVGGADAAKGSGLRGLADRVAAVDGRLMVESSAGHGTRVLAEMPCG